MKKFELIFGLIAATGIILKFTFNVIGSMFLMILSFSMLNLFYLLLSFAFFNNIVLRDVLKKRAYKETNLKRVLGSFVLGLSLAIIIIGALFKIQLWPGAYIQLKTGLIILSFVSFVAIFLSNRNTSEFFIRIFKRITIIGGIGIVLFFTPSYKLVDIYYRNDPAMAKLEKKRLANPDNEEVYDQIDSLRNMRKNN